MPSVHTIVNVARMSACATLIALVAFADTKEEPVGLVLSAT
jgi:hypothetical protein